MPQHDYVIDNQSAPAARADINAVLQAVASTNSGATAPVTPYANQLWYDTAANQLKKRNEANSAWLVLGTIDDTGGTFTPNSLLTTTGIAPATLVLSTEGIAANNNNTTIPTSAAVKAYADAAAASVVSATTANVLAATAAAGTGAVGTYAFHSTGSGSAIVAGSNYTNVNYSGVRSNGTISTSAGAAGGTWKAMGNVTAVVGATPATVFLRIA